MFWPCEEAWSDPKLQVGVDVWGVDAVEVEAAEVDEVEVVVLAVEEEVDPLL